MCLRSAISYNTDLWAASLAETNKYPLGGPAGLSPEDDVTGVLDTICEDLRKVGPEKEISGRICMTLAGTLISVMMVVFTISVSKRRCYSSRGPCGNFPEKGG